MTDLMKKKLEGKKGFTLVELLIVVAIIAILVAVSIPVYSNYTENVAKGVDQANERDAVGLATTAMLSKDKDLGLDGSTGSVDVYYKVVNNKGTLEKETSAPAAGDAGYNYGKAKDNGQAYVKVTIDLANQTTTTTWVKKTA